MSSVGQLDSTETEKSESLPTSVHLSDIIGNTLELATSMSRKAH